MSSELIQFISDVRNIALCKFYSFMNFNATGFLGNSHVARMPFSSHGTLQRHLRERDVLVVEGTSTPPSRCWPGEG